MTYHKRKGGLLVLIDVSHQKEIATLRLLRFLLSQCVPIPIVIPHALLRFRLICPMRPDSG